MTGSGWDGLPPEVRQRLREDASDEELRRFREVLSRADDGREYDVDAEWTRLEEELDGFPEPASQPDGSNLRETGTRTAGEGEKADRFPTPSRPLAAAAAALVAVLGGLAWWASTPEKTVAPPGEQVTVTLTDGSEVRLNADSRIRHARSLSAIIPWLGPRPRRVRLRGEAYFSVREEERPFRVRTENAAVEVAGTEFAVRFRREDGGSGSAVTEVVLASGAVRLGTRGTEGSVVRLERPGQKSRVVGRKAPTVPERVDLEQATAWLDGGFAVTAEPVAEVLQEVERRFGIEVRLRGRNVGGDTVTVHYGSGVRAQDVLRDLSVMQGLKFRRTADGYELYLE